MESESHPIVIVGCGPGSPDYLTAAAIRAVQEAEVLVGARRLLELFPAHPGERYPDGSPHRKSAGRHRRAAG